ncbi:MAG TPA: hypothetical protein VIO16_14335 [Dehalococcoidia bacterium]
MWSKIPLVGAIGGTVLLVAVAAGTVVTLAGGLSPKAQFAQNIQDQRAAAAHAAPARLKPAQPETPAPYAGPKAVRAQGILDIHQGPVPASEFGVTNQWAGPVNGSGEVWYRVFAGAKAPGVSGSGTPAVYVDRSTPTPDGYGVDISFVGIFTLPGADSALTITAVNGSIVDLQTQAGHVYHFDLSVNQYR